MSKTENPLVQAMLDPAFYNHSVDQLRLIETHISWVFLTGKFAYKVKKPVDFGFLDFTQLEKRKFYCEEELRLNRRLAPDIYLSVIPITKDQETYRLAGDGEIIEYAVCMQQFGQQCLLEHLLQHKKINLTHIQQLADTLAKFHSNIAVADAHTQFGNSEQVIKPVETNFSILRSVLTDTDDIHKLQRIEQASLEIFSSISNILQQRKQRGFIRECHGDMHLGNIALVEDRILIFDGIEFNDSFKWIDTMSELAFLIMDLQDHHEDVFANHLLNRYLQNTGDYAGLQVFRFYQLYRAMVRAKVAGLRLQQSTTTSSEGQQALQQLRDYLNLATQYLHPEHTFIAISHGISGSGKSWISARLAEQTDAIILRSDQERKRLFTNQSYLYSRDTTQQTYQCLLDLTTDIVRAGYSVIIDATFLDFSWRNKFNKLARGLGRDFYILYCHASRQILESRISNRLQDKNNISDANLIVMKQQLDNYQPLQQHEQPDSIDIDTGNPLDIAELAKILQTKKSSS